MNEWRKLITRAVAGRAKGGYTLRVVRDVRWLFSRRLKVSNVFDSLIATGNLFQIVGEEKLKERLPKFTWFTLVKAGSFASSCICVFHFFSSERSTFVPNLIIVCFRRELNNLQTSGIHDKQITNLAMDDMTTHVMFWQKLCISDHRCKNVLEKNIKNVKNVEKVKNV